MWEYGEREFRVANLLGCAHELYAAALLHRELYVVGVHVADAKGEDVLRRHVDAEGVDGDDDKLVERVPTIDVEGGVALREAQVLSQLQGIGVRHPLVENLREYEVRRTVEDTFHTLQEVVVVVFLEVADYGYAAACRGIVEQGGSRLLLQAYELGKVARKHLLVSADDGQPLAQ